jgi:large subunit ribosomal protein L4
MSKITLYSTIGTSKEVEAPEIFTKKEGALVTLAQALHVYRESSHKGFALARTRGNVNRTTKKIFKQKGTGNARHGARSAPIYVGGGVAHGPKGIKRVLTLSQKMRKSALFIALSLKLKEKKAALISDLSAINRSKEANKLLSQFKKIDNRVTVVLSHKNANKDKVFRNLEEVKVLTFDSLNAYNTHFGGVIVFDADIFEVEKKSTLPKATGSKETKPRKVVKK